MGLEALFGGDPRQQGILAAAAQILQASGPSRMPTSLGQILGSGMMAGQQATYEAQQRAALDQMRRMLMEEAQLDLTSKKDARALKQQIDGFARDSFRTAGQQAAALPGGPTVANAARIGEFQDGFDVETFLNKVSSVAPLQALEYRKMFAKAGPKFDAGLTFVNGPDGRPVAVRTADDGSVKQIDGLSPREKLHFLNTGGKTLGVNEYTGAEGASYTNTMDPGQRAQIGLQRERFNFDKQQTFKPVFNAELGAFITSPTKANPNGGMIPLAGLDARGPKMTEDQAKATGWLVQADNAWRNMRKVGFDGEGKLTAAARPGAADAIAAIPSFGITAPIGNALRSADRQKFVHAASSLSESLLRAATGAGVTREEAIQKIQEITPVFGEDEETTKQKMEAIPLYIESLKARAGPGAKVAARVGGTAGNTDRSGWSIERVD